MLGKIKGLARRAYGALKERKRVKHIINDGNYGFKKCTRAEYRFCKKHGFSTNEYRLFALDKNDYRDYITTLESYYPRYNNGKMTVVSDNKMVFPYVLRECFSVSENYAYVSGGKIKPMNGHSFDKDSVCDFIKDHPVILKPTGGWNGVGVTRIHHDGEGFVMNGERTDEVAIVRLMLSLKEYLMQEAISQHAYADEIFQGSLNTIRIVSALTTDECEHEIICAVQRIGTKKSAPADNFAQGGMSALIDIDSGVLSAATGALDFDEEGNRIFLDTHPEGGAITGVTVPKWDEIKDRIRRFTRMFPFFKFIAWDIAVGKNGEIYAIETNMKSSLGVIQVHGGMRNTKLFEVLESLKKKKV